MNHNVNLAVQVLPLHKSQTEAYQIIDAVIDTIKKSGLNHMVCPFETVIEGPYDRVMKLLDDMQEMCNKAGAESVIINMKLHRNFTKDLAINDKVGKYK